MVGTAQALEFKVFRKRIMKRSEIRVPNIVRYHLKLEAFRCLRDSEPFAELLGIANSGRERNYWAWGHEQELFPYNAVISLADTMNFIEDNPLNSFRPGIGV